VLISETANSLVNPTEGLVLAHQPINGATYTAAKVSHLARIVLYLVPATNGIPALAGLFLKTAVWYYPLVHLGAAIAMGMIIALGCCALFGWLMRFIPVRRLRAAGQLAGMIPLLCMSWMGQLEKMAGRLNFQALLPTSMAARRGLAVLIGAAAIAAVVFGLRSLSADYLIRVSSMMRGGASAGSRRRNSFAGSLTAHFLGGQPARAAFAFVSRLMLRDWQFRRAFVPLIFPALFGLTSIVAKGWPADPFSPGFAPIHVWPNALGILLLLICSVLSYGSDYKGAWIFQLAPSRTLVGFAGGTFGQLWIEFIVIPNLVLCALTAWRWGIFHSVLFLAYSIALGSVYLALELRLMEGIPFSTQVDPSRGAATLPALMICGAAASIVVGIQYFVLFRSPLIVASVTLALGVTAFFLARASIDNLATTMRYHLGLASEEAKPLYKEVVV